MLSFNFLSVYHTQYVCLQYSRYKYASFFASKCMQDGRRVALQTFSAWMMVVGEGADIGHSLSTVYFSNKHTGFTNLTESHKCLGITCSDFQ